MSVFPWHAAFDADDAHHHEPRSIPGSPACRHAIARAIAVNEKRSGQPQGRSDGVEPNRRPQQPKPAARLAPFLVRTAKWFGLGCMALAVVGTIAMVGTVLAFRSIDPPASALMLIRSLEGKGIDQSYVPLSKISPWLVKAVIASEDNRFCSHGGIDIKEIQNALASAKDGAPRGGSTISMQLAKNLFLWPDRSYVRKALEAPLTLLIEATWPKSRIAEVYLNVVEWGPGRYGAERASRHHFGRSAKRLTSRQAALLAVSLPSPMTRNPGRPGRLVDKLARRIEQRMRHLPKSATACVLDTTSR